MEQKIEKTMDGDQLDLKLNLKPNHATQSAAHRKRASYSIAKKLAKRRRLYNRKSKISKLRCYLNYKKSGKLEHLLFHKNGEWITFPQDVIDLVKNDLMVKKTVIEVMFNGRNLLIDFLHMYQMDLKTGKQQSIGWIDDKGMCFFPEISSAFKEESHDLCTQEHWESSLHEEHGSDDIKLNLEIKIDGLDESKLKECSGDSNALAKHIQVDGKTECGQYVVEIEDTDNKIDQGKVPEEHNQELDLDTFLKPENRKLDVDTVKKMFADGMGSMGSFGNFDIVEIFKCSSSSLQDRLDVFEKQFEITKKHRGKANLQYAWLASSKGELYPMMKYGVGYCGASRKSIYGTGVHLSSSNYAYTSVKLCDVDENGLRHLVLCRVILGRMELLRPGSKQIRPCSNEYDNGVDDIHLRHYVVWNVNANTHICPEFVVSFKISPEFEDYLTVIEKMKNVSGITGVTYQGPMGLLRSEASSDELESNKTPISNQAASDPNSYWFYLPLLVEVLKNKVPPRVMESVYTHYEEFTSKRISGEELMNMLRVLVGENEVRSAYALLRIDTAETFRNPEGNRNMFVE